MILIYLVEDDMNIRELVEYTLRSTGLDAKGFGTPSEFWEALHKDLPSLILLDIMLPEEDGLSILSKLRRMPAAKDIPVIMLTAKASEIDKVKGFESGADDYISKPFGMMELVARVKARLRGHGAVSPAKSEYYIGDLYVSPSKHIVRVGDENITLPLRNLRCSVFCLKTGILCSQGIRSLTGSGDTPLMGKTGPSTYI